MEGLAWPAAVVILGIFGMLLFRQPLTLFLQRAKRIGKGGIEAGPSEQPVKGALEPSAADELMRSFDNALIVKNEGAIRNELTTRKIVAPDERERVLLRFLAGAVVVMKFEKAYAFIWGSQLSCLQVLNEAGATGVGIELLRPWYDQAVAREPELYANDKFDRWLQFLVGQELAVLDGAIARITLDGREFLKYIVHQGYTFYKRG